LNFALHKKSKNARMGKGKGMVERKVIRIRRGVMLFEFIGIPLNKLQLLVPKLNKKLDIKFALIKKNFYSYGL
jgi:ribosomal protein L16/L10AE